MEIDIEKLPIIDISSFQNNENDKNQVAKEINKACKEYGFFYIKNHGVDQELIENLQNVIKKFFSLPLEIKMKWKMGLTNREWLGFFKVGQEITYGQVDWKEGCYYSSEMDGDINTIHNVPLYPTAEQEEQYEIQGFKSTIHTYIEKLTHLSQQIIEAISLSLNLPQDYFFKNYTYDPFILMGLLHYPSFHHQEQEEEQEDDESNNGGKKSPNPDESKKPEVEKFGTGQHTDWGLLTVLYQDDVGGLQVKSKNSEEYIDAPPIPGTFICNIGDMLDKMTGGYYLSNLHRVKYNKSGRDRFSIPFFLDPSLNSIPKLIPNYDQLSQFADKPERWDKQNIHEFDGTYGQYFIKKIGRVFPDYVYKKSGELV
ncbi:hypothetical protein DDB_G0277497 [Dictyostelium discoideum AX4]|uniref:1-aminocyclopropane-1-carboxylate oxidase n=2 Tax=Dictyostelium TaxID=5782 RepID=ACCO1_DICDI|nr:hypothetical protein DDB_G0277497 [Dictyostelium discoideum AX4]A6BM06.1 RecName: Full=1-aminocyclopropane-1-carboxylate oxidase; Short=ACC oxidase; Short=Dmaco; AltName: Full=Ethylene-forming enzyme; Short=EFE [Dictyostelium mucoroides]Q76NT9.1 RecName: Full=1-aminocyclopropane-1-carboxylate oxidase; Short=ACC oxidase; Short=Ddaco; AltName: Full=Ethylene-forming enzyme; Short=EFE [Dictyostelium discoideum]EAL68711.1 hypothetical protein DDB_G0277497 [Dictyostelium discoideum AX4]BAD13533.1 |eukprot:XP_642611.1 hypothetical protein DDB_G0277497 [Dictyostelium discoideum AX4]